MSKRKRTKEGRMKRWFAALVVPTVLLLSISGPAFASAESSNGKASCIGWGSSTAHETEVSRDQIAHEVKTFYGDLGLSAPGQVYAMFAETHAASEVDCFGEEPVE